MKFSKKLKEILLVSSAVAALAGCNSENDVPVNEITAEETCIQVKLPGKTGERAAYWTQNDATSYKVDLFKNADLEPLSSKTGNPGETVRFTVTDKGSYTVKVYAYKDTIVIAEGSAGCSVSLGEGTVLVDVKLDPKEKSVALAVNISWNSPADAFIPVENTLGTIGENLVANGDADSEGTEGIKPVMDFGGTAEVVAGGYTGNCWKITQNHRVEWQELNCYLTDVYGQGKSYLVSFKIKADPDAGANEFSSYGELLNLGYSVYSGAVQDWAIATGYSYWDWDSSNPNIVEPWGLSFSSDEVFEDIPGIDFLNVNTPVLTDEWKQYNFVIPASEIDRVANGTGVYEFVLAFSVGPSAAYGYSYLLDDIEIRDLNTELPRTGRTWVEQ